MSVQLRAGQEPASSRREFWQHVASQALDAIELRATGDIDPADRIVAGRVGSVRVGELTARHPGGAVRTTAHARRTATEMCKIDLPVDGGGLVEQDGRQAVLRPGDFALVDLSRPARWAMSPRRVIAVVFPVALLPVRAEDLRRLAAVAVPGDRGAGALVSPLATRLVEHLDEYGPAEATRLGGAVLDLIGAALCSRLDEKMPQQAGQRALALLVSAYIDDHLGDPDLSPATVAAANHLSVRTLYRLFEARRTTVTAWIRRRRLERCRRDLADPLLYGRPVSAVGARWGLPNPSHFSRVFRAEYGLPPAAYREQVIRPEPRPGAR